MFHVCKSRAIWGLGLVVVIGLLWPTASRASGTKYTWCKAEELPGQGGKRVFYSDPFPYEEEHLGDYNHGFGDYVSSHYGAKNNASCDPAYGERSRSEAKSKRDNDASFNRNLDKEVVFTGWTY